MWLGSRGESQKGAPTISCKKDGNVGCRNNFPARGRPKYLYLQPLLRSVFGHLHEPRIFLLSSLRGHWATAASDRCATVGKTVDVLKCNGRPYLCKVRMDYSKTYTI